MERLSFTGVLTAVTVFYVALGAALFFGQRFFLYQPDTNLENPAHYGVPQMRVVGAHWYAEASKKGYPVIVLFQGNAGHMGYRGFKAHKFLEQGYGVLLVGYRGYGSNTGSPTEDGLYEDARSAISALTDAGISPEKIVLYGESLGTGIAVQMAVEGHGGVMILEASYSSMVDVAFHHYPIFPMSWLLKDQFKSFDKIEQLTLPKLFIHGGKDKIIPLKYGQRLFEKAQEPKQWHQIDAAGHNDLYDHGAFDAIKDFLVQNYPELK